MPTATSPAPLPPIESFTGPFRFLSNFHYCPITYEGLTYPSLVHAFQAAKSLDPLERAFIRDSDTPGRAKKQGRAITLRPGWEQCKQNIMLKLLHTKFAPHSALAAQLLATGERKLIEGNHWGDTYWGMCDGVGNNFLGKLLMRVREELKG